VLKGETLANGEARGAVLRRLVIVIARAARAAWPALATCYLLITVVAVFQTARHFTRYPCGYDLEQCPVVEAWLSSVHLSNEFVGLLYATSVAVPATVFISLGFVLWGKVRHTTAGLVFAYILLAMWMSDITNVGVVAMWYRFWRPLEGNPWQNLAHPLGITLFAISMISVIAFALLFPTGKPKPAWTIWLLIIWTVLEVMRPLTFIHPMMEYNNWPLPFNWLIVAGVPLLAVGSLAFRYQRFSSNRERQQIRWIVPSTLAVGILFVAYQIPDAILRPKVMFEDTLARFFLETGANVGMSITASLLGTSIAFAILQHRLFDIRFVVNRALVFASMTAVVVSLYVIVVNGVNQLLEISNPLFGSVIATAFIALLFQPLYGRLQRGVNRLMYGRRDDPYGVITHLSRRLETAAAPSEVLQRIVETVADSLKLPYGAIYLTGDPRPAAVTGDVTRAGTLTHFTLIHQNENLGELVLSPREGETQFSPREREVLHDLARTAGIAAYAARSTLTLRASRERLVIAREEERRRLRRDLHDGLAPLLAGIVLSLDRARSLATEAATAESEHEQLAGLLADIKQQTQTAAIDVRHLVHDLRPAMLDELGLAKAIREQARNVSGNMRIAVDAPESLPDLPAAVEVAAYRIVQEALNNVIHHANAQQCQVSLMAIQKSPMTLVIQVTDDGIGLPDNYQPGVGIDSIRERAEELGGTFEIGRQATGGTRMVARLPIWR
jgi:signal transduction histidine kinase